MASSRSTAPKSRPDRRADADSDAHGYLAWSRDPAVGVFAVLPLWLAYEGLRLWLAPTERNGAEAYVTERLHLLGPNALLILRVLLATAVLAAAVSIHRRGVPWLRVALVSALEGAVYGLMLGPVAGLLTVHVLDGARLLAVQGQLAQDLIGSLSAGIFEEAVFRLCVLSLVALLFVQVCRALKLPHAFGIGCAVVVSAVLFSAAHHVLMGNEPFRADVAVFRAVAGVLLGVLFVFRGFAVCVYAHSIYDLHHYLVRA